jgi:sortase A
MTTTTSDRFRQRGLPAARRRRRAKPAVAVVPLSASSIALIWVSLTVSFLACWTIGYGYLFSGLQEHRTNTVLYSTLRQNLSSATTPIGGVISPGTPVALLQASTLGLSNTVVVEGTTSTELRSGPGHLRNSPLPGQAGISVLLGKSTTYGGAFARLSRVAAGDTIKVTTGQGEFTYTVERIRRPGDPLPAPPDAGRGRLMLETSSGLNWSRSSALYVDARLEGNPQPTPSGRLRSVTNAEKPMRGDSSGLVTMVFWLQALVLITIGSVWAWLRWGRWQTWLVGLPLCLAVLWGISENALLLLPNLV